MSKLNDNAPYKQLSQNKQAQTEWNLICMAEGGMFPLPKPEKVK